MLTPADSRSYWPRAAHGRPGKVGPRAGARLTTRSGDLMIWTLELASYLEDAPWPATKEELVDYAVRTGAPIEVIQNLEELEDTEEPYESIEEIWPDYPTDDDFFYEDEKDF